MSQKKPMGKATFMILGTLFNIALIVVFFFLFLILAAGVMRWTGMADEYFQYLFLLVLGLSFLCAFLVYRAVVKWAVVKFRLEESFKPKRWNE